LAVSSDLLARFPRHSDPHVPERIWHIYYDSQVAVRARDAGLWRAGWLINIAVGPDRNIWFTKRAILGRVTSGGVIMEFPLSSPMAGSTGLTVGSGRQPPARLSNRLWVAQSGDTSIAFLSFR